MVKKEQGFTLIELMIVLAIVSIIVAIAVPSYRITVLKSRRADAEGALLGFANAMERHFTTTNSYCDAGAALGGGANSCGGAALDSGKPSVYATRSPVDGGTIYYELTLVTTAVTYTLTATPQGAQASDSCGTLTLDQTGTKVPINWVC